MKKKMAKVFVGLSIMVFLLSTTVVAAGEPKRELEQSHYLHLTIPLIAELSLVADDPVELVFNHDDEFFSSDEITVTYRCNAKNWALQLSADDFSSPSPADLNQIPAAGYLAAIVGDTIYYFVEEGITIASNEDTDTAEKTVN